MKLKSYASEVIQVLGQPKAEVSYKEQQATLTPLEVKGAGPSHFGHDWLAAFHLDWVSNRNIICDNLMGALDQYHYVFTPEFGTLQEYQRRIKVDPLATPPFLQSTNSSLCNAEYG